MDEGIDRRGSSAAPAWMPWALAALAVATIVQLGVRVAPEWYSIVGPYLLIEPRTVLGILRAVSPFVLAGAVLLGAERWPAGRLWLQWGAVALALQGLLGLAFDIWLATWDPSSATANEGVQPLLVGRSIASSMTLVAAPALLAAGLWATRTPGTVSARRRNAMAVVGLIGVIGLATSGWVIPAYMGPWGGVLPDWYGIVSIGTLLLTGLGFSAMALLAIVAIRVMPRHGPLPEVLIAVGATIVSGVGAWEWAFPWIIPLQDQDPAVTEWAFLVTSVVMTIGLASMIVGFASARSTRQSLTPGGRTV